MIKGDNFRGGVADEHLLFVEPVDIISILEHRRLDWFVPSLKPDDHIMRTLERPRDHNPFGRVDPYGQDQIAGDY